MRPSLRFLAIAVIGWTAVRAATLDMLPGAELFRIGRSEARPPPIVPTQFAEIEPLPAATPGDVPFMPAAYPQVAPVAGRHVIAPLYQAPVSRAVLPDFGELPLTPRRSVYSALPPFEPYPLSRLASASTSPLQSVVTTPGQSVPAVAPPRGRDRLQLSAWALLRAQQGGIAGSRSLASGGQLGGSQAGARLTYEIYPRIAAAVRMSNEVGRRGGEVAAGVRVQPLQSLPIWFTAERRQRIGKYGGGRSAFALFAESGIYQRPIAWGFNLDGYIQGGVVGARRRDLFVDGAATFTKPVYRQFSAGFGVWGGAQPGVYRIDAGPRLSMQVHRNVRVHADWRQRVAGNARPGSGAALTVAGDF